MHNLFSETHSTKANMPQSVFFASTHKSENKAKNSFSANFSEIFNKEMMKNAESEKNASMRGKFSKPVEIIFDKADSAFQKSANFNLKDKPLLERGAQKKLLEKPYLKSNEKPELQQNAAKASDKLSRFESQDNSEVSAGNVAANKSQEPAKVFESGNCQEVSEISDNTAPKAFESAKTLEDSESETDKLLKAEELSLTSEVPVEIEPAIQENCLNSEETAVAAEGKTLEFVSDKVVLENMSSVSVVQDKAVELEITAKRDSLSETKELSEADYGTELFETLANEEPKETKLDSENVFESLQMLEKSEKTEKTDKSEQSEKHAFAEAFQFESEDKAIEGELKLSDKSVYEHQSDMDSSVELENLEAEQATNLAQASSLETSENSEEKMSLKKLGEKDFMPEVAEHKKPVKASFEEQNTSKEGFAKNFSSREAPSDAKVEPAKTVFKNELYEMIEKAGFVKNINGKQTIEMELKESKLGKLSLKLVSEEGTVSARLVVENNIARARLESATAEIRETLANQGVDLKEIFVDVRAGDSDSYSGEAFNKSENSSASRAVSPEKAESARLGSYAISESLRRKALHIKQIDVTA